MKIGELRRRLAGYGDECDVVISNGDSYANVWSVTKATYGDSTVNPVVEIIACQDWHDEDWLDQPAFGEVDLPSSPTGDE